MEVAIKMLGKNLKKKKKKKNISLIYFQEMLSTMLAATDSCCPDKKLGIDCCMWEEILRRSNPSLLWH